MFFVNICLARNISSHRNLYTHCHILPICLPVDNLYLPRWCAAKYHHAGSSGISFLLLFWSQYVYSRGMHQFKPRTLDILKTKQHHFVNLQKAFCLADVLLKDYESLEITESFVHSQNLDQVSTIKLQHCQHHRISRDLGGHLGWHHRKETTFTYLTL